MKKTILVREINKNTKKYINKDIVVSGWVRTLRSSKNFGFIEMNDGSFFKNIQIVFDTSLDNYNDITKLSISSSIKVEGKLVETEGAKQPFEIHAAKIEIQLLIYAQEQILLVQRLELDLYYLMQFINFSKRKILCMFILQL